MTDNFNNDAIQATAALAGATVVAAGVWKIFEQASDTFKSFITSKDKADAQNLYEKALQYQLQGIHNEAISLFQEALKKDPTHSDAYNSIAWFYAINNISLCEAEGYAHSAIKFACDVSSRSNAIDTLAEIYFRQNKIQQAIVTFHNCLLIDQKRLDSYYRLSRCYQLNKNTLEAYKCLTETIKLQQENDCLDIYQRLGTVCLELGRYSEAVKNLKFAIELSNQQVCYGLTDWGDSYQIPYGEVLQIRRCESLLNLGLAYLCLKDIVNSKSCLQAANQAFPNHPYPIFNLACIASRSGNKDELRSLLETLMPIIADKSYGFDPPNISNKVISFSAHILVEQLLGDPDLETHQDILLETLKSYGKITEYAYRERKNAFQERLITGYISKTEESKVYINIHNSTVGGFALGENSNISSKVVSQDFLEISPESNSNLSKEINDILKELDDISKELSNSSFELKLDYFELKLDAKERASPNDLTIKESSDSSSNFSANQAKKKLHRST